MKRKNQAFSHDRSFWMFVLPSLLLFGVFFLLPLGMSIWFSFTNYDGWKTMDFMGIKNYVDILTSGDFYKTLSRTMVYTACNLPFKVAIPLLLAALVTSQSLKGTTLVRTLVYPGPVLGFGSRYYHQLDVRAGVWAGKFPPAKDRGRPVAVVLKPGAGHGGHQRGLQLDFCRILHAFVCWGDQQHFQGAL